MIQQFRFEILKFPFLCMWFSFHSLTGIVFLIESSLRLAGKSVLIIYEWRLITGNGTGFLKLTMFNTELAYSLGPLPT
jgi:hypothetical protein